MNRHRINWKQKKVSGIYYVGTEPLLTVASSGIEESILQSVLSSYENTRSTVRNMLKIHPEGIFDGLRAMLRQQNSVQELSLGRQDHRWKRAVFLCTDCQGVSTDVS